MAGAPARIMGNTIRTIIAQPASDIFGDYPLKVKPKRDQGGGASAIYCR